MDKIHSLRLSHLDNDIRHFSSPKFNFFPEFSDLLQLNRQFRNICFPTQCHCFLQFKAMKNMVLCSYEICQIFIIVKGLALMFAFILVNMKDSVVTNRKAPFEITIQKYKSIGLTKNKQNAFP